MSDFGAAVRRRREDLGKSPGEAAIEAEMSEIYWRQIEYGAREPKNIDTLERVARALDWDLNDIRRHMATTSSH